MLSFTTRFFSLRKLGGLLLLGALPQLGQAQGTSTKTITTSPAYRSVITVSSGTLYINAGVVIENTAIHVTGSNVTIYNQGTIKDNNSRNNYGVIDVDRGLRGVVINNVGVIDAQTMRLRSAVTLCNGSRDGGATQVAGATWRGSLANTCDAAPVIANYALWQAQVQELPGGTITNARGATWSGYLSTADDLRITNAGTWSSQVQEAYGCPTISIVHNGGTWSGSVGGGNGSLCITNNANWTEGFNFPRGADNSFTTAVGATTSYDAYLGLGGQVALINKGTMTLRYGMGTLDCGSSLTLAAGSKMDLKGDFNNEGTVFNAGVLATAGNFFNSGVIAGPKASLRGSFTAKGYTYNCGNFGADGSYLDFCDGGAPSRGFDVPGGTIGRNVTFCTGDKGVVSNPLPVTLTSFTAQAQPGQVLLRWATATEQANDRFEVERSADGSRFGAVHTVAGQGTTASTHTYSYPDAQPLPGTSYYRLRQVDSDGTSTYSPVVSVQSAQRDEPAATVLAYPNPTAGSLQLDLRPYQATTCEVRVLNALGQLVQRSLVQGGQVQPLALHHLPAGPYLLCLNPAGQRPTVQRIEKQ